MYLFANIWNVDHEVHSASSEIKYNLKVKVKSLSHVQLFAIPWTIACQAPPSMGFSWQEYWSGLPLPSPYSMYGYYKILTIFTVFWLLCCTMYPFLAALLTFFVVGGCLVRRS